MGVNEMKKEILIFDSSTWISLVNHNNKQIRKIIKKKNILLTLKILVEILNTEYDSERFKRIDFLIQNKESIFNLSVDPVNIIGSLSDLRSIEFIYYLKKIKVDIK